MKWPEDTKALVEQYSRGYAWMCLYDKAEEQQENFDKVNTRLMDLEVQLREKGVTNDQLGEIIRRIKELMAKNTDEMSSRELEFVCQVIFGKEVKVTSRDKDSDRIIKVLVDFVPQRGFVPAWEVAAALKLPMEHTRDVLQDLANRGEVLQYKPRHDSWAVSTVKRDEVLGRNQLKEEDIDKEESK